MRRVIAAWLVAAVGLTGVGLAQLAIPAEYAQKRVDLNVSPEGLSLEDALRALGKSLGIPIFFKDLPKDRLTVSLKDRTLKDVLDLLSRVYGDGLSYTWLPERAILVAPRSAVQTMFPAKKPSTPAPTKPTTPSKGEYIAQVFAVPQLDKDFLAGLKSLAPQTSLAYSEGSGVLLLSGPPDEVARVSPVLREAIRVAQSKQEAKEGPAPVTRTVRLGGPLSQDQLSAAAKTLGIEAALVGDSAVLRGGKEAVDELARILTSLPPAAPTSSPPKTAPPVLKILTLPEGREEGYIKAVGALLPDLRTSVVAPGVVSVLGPEETVAQAASLAGAVPPPPKPPEAPKESKPDTRDWLTKAYPLFGDPEGVNKALQAAFPKEETVGTLEVIPQAKSLVVRGPYPLHQAVVNLLKEVDPPPAPTPTAATGEVQATLPLLRIAPDKAGEYLKALGLGVRIVPHPTGNQVWLIGKKDEVARAMNLLQEADRVEPQARIRVRAVQMNKQALSQLQSGLDLNIDGVKLGLGGGGLSSALSLPLTLLRSLELNINALEGKSEAKTLINTEVVLKNEGKSRLNSGGSLVINTTPPSSGNGGGSGGGAAAPATSSLEYGLVIDLGGKIVSSQPPALDLNVSIQIGDPPTQGPVSGSVQISKRSLDTSFRLRDGEGVLLGGLIQRVNSQSESGVPILSWIPIIGDLFKTKKDTTQEEGFLLILEGQVEGATAILPQLYSQEEKAPSTPSAPPEDPRTPPSPPPATSSAAPSGTPQAPASAAGPAGENTPQTAGSTPQATPPTPTRAAPWARMDAVWSGGQLGAYVQSTDPTAPMFRVVGAYAQEASGGFVELQPRPRPDWIAPTKSGVVNLYPGGKLKNPYDLTLILEDELGGRWYIRSPVTLR